jgi:DNA polymerase
MTIPLFLDTETYCETPIANGVHRYAEDVEVIMWQWAVGDGPVILRDHDEPIDDLLALLADPQYEVVIHNSAFDRTVIRHATDIVIPVERIFDTMICAMAHSLPGALAQLCDILGVPTDKAKDKEGKTWIGLFCKPQPKGRKLRRATKHTHPLEWQRFRDYGALDIIAMREVYNRLPRWNYRGDERALWELDQRINDRGVCMDIDLAVAAIRASTRAQEDYAVETLARTDGAVASTNQRDKLLGHILEAYGVSLPDLTGSTLERRVEDPDLPLALRELLAIRLQASKTSVSKYKRVVNGVSRDGRLRGLLAFCGALRTGRWAGRLLQPQNLPRPTLKNKEIERGIEALKANAEDLI